MPAAKEEEFGGTERFRVERRLGAGAFGVVYQVLDRERNEVVALKTLREGNVEALFRLKREFRALADLAHTNLVRLKELLADGDRWFFTMELVDGVNFLQWIRGEAVPGPAALPDALTEPAPAAAHAPPPREISRHAARPDRIRAALRQAVTGIDALHRAGQIHRDLKPSNVLISRENRLVILDFGLVTDVSDTGSKRSISVVGTPAYMSPEQGAGHSVSPATDWYSLGVMLFEALTGRWPFTGSFVEMIWDKRHAEAPAPRDVSPMAPEDLNALCRDLLRRDPQARPGAEEILARLGEIQAATYERGAERPTSPAAAPFVGRVEPLEALRSAFRATRDGRAVVVRLHGASGTGKTALARHFLEELQRRGDAVILSGRCYERESVPYKALDSLVDALSQFLKKLPAEQAREVLPRDVLALARLFPVLRRVEAIAGARRRVLEIPDSQEQRRRAFGALRELFSRLAEQQDVVLFLDDLQWGDVDSAALLAEIFRPPRPPALLLLACYRTEEGTTSPFLRSFLQEPSPDASVETRDLELRVLSGSEARELTAALLGGAAPERVEEIASESGGNPFFLSELVRFGLAGLDPSEAKPPSGLPPERGPTLEDVIRSRVARLPEPARLMLEVLAVAGHPLRAAIARRAAGIEDHEEDPKTLLRERHLIRTRTLPGLEEIEPYHDRIREVVSASLSADVKRAHHRGLALALEGSGTSDPEALALHFHEAGEAERAAEYSSAAAVQAAEALAFDRAARLYRVALEQRNAADPARRDLCIRLADALANAGHGAEAAQAYLDAVSGAPADVALDLRRRAAEQFLISGRIEEGLATLRTVLEKVGLRLAESPRAALFSMLWRRLLVRLRGLRFRERDATQISRETLSRIDVCWSATKGITLADPIRGNDFHSRQLLMALRAGEPYRIARALALEAGYSATSGGRTRRRTKRLLQFAEALANRIDDPYAIGWAMSVAGIAANLEGRWKAARDLTRSAGTVLRERCRGVAWEIDNSNYYSLLALAYLGEFRELQEALPALLKEAEDRGDLFAATNMRTRLSYLARLAQDEPRQAREELRRAIEAFSPRGYVLQHWYELSGQVETLLYEGAAGGAREHLLARWPALEESLFLRFQSVRINSLHLRARTAIAAAAAESAGNERLLSDAARDVRRIEREDMPWGNALARLLSAGVASVRGSPAEAVAHLASAEKMLDAADMALYAEVSRFRRGALTAGDAGRALAASAAEAIRAQGIRDSDRMADVWAPGLWKRPPDQGV